MLWLSVQIAKAGGFWKWILGVLSVIGSILLWIGLGIVEVIAINLGFRSNNPIEKNGLRIVWGIIAIAAAIWYFFFR